MAFRTTLKEYIMEKKIMEAKALICNEKQEFSLEDVIVPDPTPNQIGIKTINSGVSSGTEFALVRNKISWGPYPICTGYMGVGKVDKVGTEISNFKTGDIVYYRGNAAMTFPDGAAISCVSGTHCSYVVTEPNTTHGAALVPKGAPLDATSMFVLPAVGLYGVDMANPRMGETVVVYGVGLIGMGVVAFCSQRGCRVIAVDINSKQLEKAKEFGADIVINSAEQDVKSEVAKIVPAGADAVFESTGIPSLINEATQLCKTHGSFVWQGNYGETPVSFDFMKAHVRRLRMFFPCDDGWQPCRKAVVKQMAMGILPWEKLITNKISYQEAPEIFAKINSGSKEIAGVIINWKE